jgi:hypothetical protein
MINKVFESFSKLLTFSFGILLVFNLHAGNAQSQRDLPAGIVKIPLNVRADSPKIEFFHEHKLIVSASISKNRVGEALLFRFLPSGRLDPDFGDAGVVTTHADGTYASITSLTIQSLTIQPDGKIVVAGEAATNEMLSDDFLLMRFLPDGRPDKSLDGKNES